MPRARRASNGFAWQAKQRLAPPGPPQRPPNLVHVFQVCRPARPEEDVGRLDRGRSQSGQPIGQGNFDPIGSLAQPHFPPFAGRSAAAGRGQQVEKQRRNDHIDQIDSVAAERFGPGLSMHRLARLPQPINDCLVAHRFEIAHGSAASSGVGA